VGIIVHRCSVAPTVRSEHCFRACPSDVHGMLRA
jgi:hypothetical protein